MPKLFNVGMRSTPISVELLYFVVGELIGKLAECINTAGIAECEVTSFADVALFRRDLVGSCGKYLRRRDAIWLILRIAGRVEAAIVVKLPLLAGNPR